MLVIKQMLIQDFFDPNAVKSISVIGLFIVMPEKKSLDNNVSRRIKYRHSMQQCENI